MVKQTKKLAKSLLLNNLRKKCNEKGYIMVDGLRKGAEDRKQFNFQTRKYFFLSILLIGIAALLCTFYYTSYYPIQMWSLSNQINICVLPSTSNNISHETSTDVIGSNFDGKEKGLRCQFPLLNAFDPSIIPYLENPPVVQCSKNYPLVFTTNFGNKLIKIGHPFSPLANGQYNYSCCYKVVKRRVGMDHDATLSAECHPLVQNETEIPPSHEFISIICENYASNESDSTDPISNATETTKRPLLNNGSNTNIYEDMISFVPLKQSVEERIQNFENSSVESNTEDHRVKLSVLILGIDGQSRMNFIREMPKSYEYLTKNLSAIELKGYTKVGDNTLPNTIPMLAGLTEAELVETCYPSKDSYFDECPFIWKKFAENGYRTSTAEDSVWMGAYHYGKKGFFHSPTDYYFHPMSLLMDKKLGHGASYRSNMCFGPRLAFQTLLDYVKMTATTFKGLPYFQYIWSNSLFHDYSSYPRIGDEALANTLEFLNENGFLNNTALLVMSDHGIRWGYIRELTYQGKIEERMPAAFFKFPNWFEETFPEAVRNLERNAYRLTTSFDFHETLLDILELGQKEGLENFKTRTINEPKEQVKGRGISLFQQIPLNRSCEQGGVDEHWCVCSPTKPISPNSTVVHSAAEFIVEWINNRLGNYSQLCSPLNLVGVREARRTVTEDEKYHEDDDKNGLEFDQLWLASTSFSRNSSESEELNEFVTLGKKLELQLTLTTTPGEAIFEVTTIHEPNENTFGNHASNLSWTLGGDISRLSLYATQSSCTFDYTIKKYCFCLNQNDTTID